MSPASFSAIFILLGLTATGLGSFLDDTAFDLAADEAGYLRTEAKFAEAVEQELKDNWTTVNTALTAHFAQLQPEEWLERHTRVSEADFVLEPHRNKLNVLISRTNHISYHAGQLVLLPNRK